MNHRDMPISAAQAVLDTHQSVLKKIEIANHAMLDAVKAVMEFDDPTAANMFGADAELLRTLAATSKSKLLPLIMTGIPLFSVRIATPEFKAVLDNNEGDDAALQVVLKSFGGELQITSL